MIITCILKHRQGGTIFPLKTDEVCDRSADPSKKEIEKLTLKPTSVIAQILGGLRYEQFEIRCAAVAKYRPRGKKLIVFPFYLEIWKIGNLVIIACLLYGNWTDL